MEAPKTNLAVIFTIALAAMIMTALAASLLPAQRKIPSSGNIKTLGITVYADEACTQSLTFIGWGLVEPGSSYKRDIWINNTGNTQVKLSMTTEGWNPAEAEGYITLTWDKEGATLNVKQLVKATLTLTVSASVTQTNVRDFSFTIVITGNEY
jgi:hypothetical protein